MSKRIQGWAPELHGGQLRPKRKSELTEEDKKRIEIAKDVEKAIGLLMRHRVIKWDKTNPREWDDLPGWHHPDRNSLEGAGVTPEEQQKYNDWITAIHEGGHVLGARLAGSEIYEATIVPSKRFDGCVRTNTSSYSEEGMLEFLLGRAAELEFGFDSWGQEYDYAQVEKALKAPVRRQRSEAWARTNGQRETFIVFGWQINPRTRWDAKTGQHISLVKEWRKAVRVPETEWKAEFDRLRSKARRLAKKHRAYIEKVAMLLVEKRTLKGEEIPPVKLYQATTACSTTNKLAKLDATVR